MTVRIRDAGRADKEWGRLEQVAGEFPPEGERITAYRPLARHRLRWRFAVQVGRKPKANWDFAG